MKARKNREFHIQDIRVGTLQAIGDAFKKR